MNRYILEPCKSVRPANWSRVARDLSDAYWSGSFLKWYYETGRLTRAQRDMIHEIRSPKPQQDYRLGQIIRDLLGEER